MPPATANWRPVLVVLLIIWIFTASDLDYDDISDPEVLGSRHSRQEAALSVLNSSSWGDFAPLPAGAANDTLTRYLNLTGFREEDGYAWEDLGLFKDRCRQLSDNAKLVRNGKDPAEYVVEPVWQNATGIVHGTYARKAASVARFPTNYNLTDLNPLVNWPVAHDTEWDRNITSRQGHIVIRLEDGGSDKEYQNQTDLGGILPGGRARAIAATMSIEDTLASGTLWDMKLHGVHWVREGAILLTTTSQKYSGIYGLPHLVPTLEFFEPARQLINRTLRDALERDTKDNSDAIQAGYSSSAGTGVSIWHPTPHCEYVAYLQLISIQPQQLGLGHIAMGPNSVPQIIENIERELVDPSGMPIPRIPEYQVSAIIYSPDCAFFLESKGPPDYAALEGRHLIGFKEEMLFYHVRMWFYGLALVLMGQLWLLKNQTKESSTPSTMGRVSFWTAGMMLVADGIAFSGSATLSLSFERTHLAALVVVFPSVLLIAIGGNFLSDIYAVQEPERRRRDRNNPNGANRPSTGPSTRAPDSLPRPVTAPPPRTPSPPVIVPSDQDIDAEIEENARATDAGGNTNNINNNANTTTNNTNNPPSLPFSTIMSRFFLCGTLILFVSISAMSWYPWARTAYCNVICFLYFSFWVPQILRNVYRNCRRALGWPFMIGQSVLRLLPVAYFYVVPDNIMFARTDYYSFCLLAGWIWVQLCCLAWQDVLGPRFLVPKSWVPEAWDYHPVLSEDAMEAGGLPIGLVSAPGSPSLDRTRTGEENAAVGQRRKTMMRMIDCAICCEDLTVPVIKAGNDDPMGGGVAGVLARRQYMVTPCRHIFHSQCLEGWMRFRLQCPICREELPPL